MINQRFFNYSAVVLAAILFLSANVLADRFLGGSRIDLTERDLFTLSDGTLDLLGGLDEPVTLKLYYSRSLSANAPTVRNHAENVINMLEEYQAASNGRIRLEVIDPEPFSEAEDRAVDAGLSGVPIGPGGENFYFGLVGTNMTDDQEAIGFFSPERARFLEYDLTRTIYGLSNPDRPKLSIVSSYPLEWGPGGVQAAMRGQSRPYGIMQPMQEFFITDVLPGSWEEIPADTEVLMLLHARDLTPQQIYAIDQYIVKGGKALVFADPFSETGAQLPPAGGAPNPLDRHELVLPELFQAWGVEVEQDRIVGDRGNATRVNAGQGRRSIIDYVGWITAGPDALNGDDVVTAELQMPLIMPTAGHIRQTEDATLDVRPLVLSSADSMLFEASRFRHRPNPQALLADMVPTEERYVLAARLRGPVKSAFEAAPGGVEAEHVAQSDGSVEIILVADADMMDDRYWLTRQQMLGQEISQPTSGNGSFLINALDNLAGSADLIGLRSRAEGDRPFRRIEELRRAAEQQYLAEEQALVEKLSETEAKLAELQSKTGEGSTDLLSSEEQEAIETFQNQMLETRRDLRAVQHSLRSDIEALQSRVQLANLALMPALVLLFAIGIALYRRQRRIASQRVRET
ncbi:MAG: Gldg family protein [Minwuia sp.]|uniref:GldG family protein n=1 Tax=Minwuia sp. TaxID=2493630 RepID=UPI003A872426